MAIKYKLVQKSTNPRDPDAPKNWYAVPQSEAALEGKAMTKEATRGSTVAPIEMEAALDLLADFVPGQLHQGHTVVVPGLGRFRITFKSRGSETVEGFNPTEMIYDARVVFMADKAFRERILQGITFEDGGVLEDGVSYKTRADYQRAKNPDAGEEGTPEGV